MEAARVLYGRTVIGVDNGILHNAIKQSPSAPLQPPLPLPPFPLDPTSLLENPEVLAAKLPTPPTEEDLFSRLALGASFPRGRLEGQGYTQPHFQDSPSSDLTPASNLSPCF